MCSRSVWSSRVQTWNRGGGEADLQLQTLTFHPTNDAAADEDPDKDSDDSMETLTYSCK